MNAEHPVAFVLGAGQGHGRAIALALAQRGYRIAAFDFSPMHLDETIAAIRAEGGEARAYMGDIIKKIAFQGVVNQITDDWGRIDVAVTAVEANPTADIIALDEWDWHRALDINLTVPFLVTQVCGRVMRAQGGGVIVHLGLGEPTNAPPGVPYLAGKTGLLALVPIAAEQWRTARVRVHAVLTARPGEAWPRLRSFAELPGAPRRVAEAVAALTAPEAADLTGGLWAPMG